MSPGRALVAPARGLRPALAVVGLVGLLAPLHAAAAPVGDALARPALMVKAPQRGVLLSAARAGDRLVAVGERGLIIGSDDGGTTWRQAASPVAVTLTTVRFADAGHGVAVGHGGTVLVSSDGGRNWQLRLEGKRVAQIVLDAAKAAADPARLKEAERLVADGPDKPFLDVAIWDTKRLLVTGAYGLALHSVDGGQSWQPWMERLPNPKALHLYVLRRHGDTLLIAGEQGLLLRSDDGGASFKALASPYRGSWFAGELLASGEVVLAGLRGNAWRSVDGGGHWTRISVPMPASITASLNGEDGRLLFANQAGHVLRRDGERLQPLTREPLPPLSGLVVAPGGLLLATSVAGVLPVALQAGPAPGAASAAGPGASRPAAASQPADTAKR